MGNTDSVPIVSQAKSAVQFSMGDTPGARATQNNFFMNNTFPILSQAASLGYAAAGNNEKALDLQAKFAEDMGTVIDSIPVAGHIKGGIHYALGQNDKGEESMKAASRSVGVVVGGVGGFAAGGPAGGFAGGIAGGLISDSIISGVDFMAKGEKEGQLYGYLSIMHSLDKGMQKKEEITPAVGFDMAMLPISDGTVGM